MVGEVFCKKLERTPQPPFWPLGFNFEFFFFFRKPSKCKFIIVGVFLKKIAKPSKIKCQWLLALRAARTKGRVVSGLCVGHGTVMSSWAAGPSGVARACPSHDGCLRPQARGAWLGHAWATQVCHVRHMSGRAYPMGLPTHLPALENFKCAPHFSWWALFS